MERRKFIKNAALSSIVLPGLIMSLDSCRSISRTKTSTDDLRQYEPNLGDRLWMWGHGPGTTNDRYNIPTGKNIDMADAIDYMGIPNICVIRWLGKPEPPFDEYIKQFHKAKRVAWSVIDGAPQSYEQKKQWAFELSEKMPNLVSFYLDDYFVDRAIPEAGQEDSPTNLTFDEILDLRKEMDSLKRPADLSVVVYDFQIQSGIKRHIEVCDVVSFWTWRATELVNLEDNFRKYRDNVPDKPTLLGIYMWDFGNKKPITMELMKLQLDFALRKFQEKQIEGMIFHCTPLVDLGLEVVEYSKKWIAEHGNIER